MFVSDDLGVFTFFFLPLKSVFLMRSSKSVFLTFTSIYYSVCFGFSFPLSWMRGQQPLLFFYLIQVISIPRLYPSVLSSFAARTRPVFMITWMVTVYIKGRNYHICLDLFSAALLNEVWLKPSDRS